MKNKNEIPSAADFGLLRAYLAQAGVAQAEINEVIGASPDGRTRGEITDQIRAWLKDAPKAD